MARSTRAFRRSAIERQLPFRLRRSEAFPRKTLMWLDLYSPVPFMFEHNTFALGTEHNHFDFFGDLFLS